MDILNSILIQIKFKWYYWGLLRIGYTKVPVILIHKYDVRFSFKCFKNKFHINFFVGRIYIFWVLRKLNLFQFNI